MTREEFITKNEPGFQSIVFAGYTYKGDDPAQIYRQMCNKNELLRILLGKVYDQFVPPAPLPVKPQPPQPQPQPPRKP